MSIRVVVSIQDSEKCNQIARAIEKESNAEVIAVTSLYDLPDDDELWLHLRKPSETLVVLSEIHPRPAACLLQTRGAIFTCLRSIDVREFQNNNSAIESVLDCLRNDRPHITESNNLVLMHKPVAKRWYPIIDKSLCVSCGQCEQFCLFGVYSNTDGVFVDQPDNCKPGCPACSRICPQGAIIFPMYFKDSAICGAPGSKMTPDPEARKMYYTRTQKTCPVCVDKSVIASFAGGQCPECGRSIPMAEEKKIESELDKLIDEFDKLQFGG